MPTSLNARLYYFACEVLWCSLSLYHYLAEVTVLGSISAQFSQLDPPLEDLAEWALNERHFPVETEIASQVEEAALFSAAGKLRDALVAGWSQELQSASQMAYQRYSYVSQVMWLHYSYCTFLQGVLDEFSQLVQELDPAKGFNTRYEEASPVFNKLRNACHAERSTVTKISVANKEVIDQLLAEMEAVITRLQRDWRQAVESAAQAPVGNV